MVSANKPVRPYDKSLQTENHQLRLRAVFCGQDWSLFYWLLNNQIVAMLSSEAVALTIKKTLVGGIHINDRCAVAPLRKLRCDGQHSNARHPVRGAVGM